MCEGLLVEGGKGLFFRRGVFGGDVGGEEAVREEDFRVGDRGGAVDVEHGLRG